MLSRTSLLLLVTVIGLAMAAPLLAAEGSHGGEGNLNPLSPEAWKTDLALWTAVVFLVLMAVLAKFAWRPLAEGLQRREQGIADQIAQAEEANREAKKLLANYEKKLTDARDEVRAIVEQGRRDAEQVGQQMLEKARAETKAEHERAVQQIEAATASAVKELADRSAALAVDLAGKIVRAQLKPSDHAKLIEQAVAGFVQGEGGADVSQN
jgi:F-type H+-transporting ATPase subunit b